jgi:hypothetical protein
MSERERILHEALQQAIKALSDIADNEDERGWPASRHWMERRAHRAQCAAEAALRSFERAFIKEEGKRLSLNVDAERP